MNDLFKKLNVLVKSSLHDLLGDDSSGRNRSILSLDKLGKGIDDEIANLRERINEALNYEDELTARVQTLQAEVADWDQQADDAVRAGNDEKGRYAVSHMQLAQQRLAMAEADLVDHQRVTQELILRVNELEAAVADARHAQSSETAPAEESPSAQEDQALGSAVNRMAADVLRDMREKVTEMSEMMNVSGEAVPGANLTDEQEPATTVDERQIEDDLTRRRNRLSKK